MKNEHYFSEKQESVFRINSIEILLRGSTFKFDTVSGVFSVGRVDKGSYLLIEKCIVEDGWRVLDLGCGYGVTGIAIAKVFDCEVVLTDVNKRAAYISKKNAKKNNVEVSVLRGDMYEKIDGLFDTILFNPPQHAGKKLCMEMIEKAKDYLKKKGLLQVVARHNKGGKSFALKMEEIFGNIKDIAKKGGYRIYVSEKK
jgi:16S rRNA (guanine1207-N2)-methyltransferase